MERISDLEKPRCVCAYSHHSRGGDFSDGPGHQTLLLKFNIQEKNLPTISSQFRAGCWLLAFHIICRL